MTACSLRRAKGVLLVHDVYPEALFAAGLLRRQSLFGKIAEWIGAWPYRITDRVVVLGRDMQDLVAKRSGGAGKILLIPNWADSDEVRPADRGHNSLLEQRGLTDRWVVLCSGNMGRTHGLETAIAAAALLVATEPSVHFLFVGSGARFPMLEAAAGTLPNVTAEQWGRRHEPGTVLNACDVALVCLTAGMAGVSVPSRMYNILAAGKPIIAVVDDESEVARVIREGRVGWVVPPGRPDLLAAAVRASRSEVSLDADISARARRLAEKYSRQAAIEAYAQMVCDLVTPDVSSTDATARTTVRRSA